MAAVTVHSNFRAQEEICHYFHLFPLYLPWSNGSGGWDGWMASLTPWTWVWVNSGSWWWTGRPGVLRFMGLQRVGHDWVTDLIWSDLNGAGCHNLSLFALIFSLKPALSFSSFTLIKRFLSSSSHLHIWGCWCFSWLSWSQLVIHPAFLLMCSA